MLSPYLFVMEDESLVLTRLELVVEDESLVLTRLELVLYGFFHSGAQNAWVVTKNGAHCLPAGVRSSITYKLR